MIIDAHTHIFPDEVAGKAIKTIVENAGSTLEVFTDGTHEDLLASMNDAGIDYSIVLPVATSLGHGGRILQWIRTLNPHSPRLIFFGAVHPADHDYKDIIKEIKEEGLQGIKFHPGYQNFPADSKEAYKVYEEALNNGLVLHFHSGFDPSLPECDYTSVERFANLVRDFHGSKIILAHAGGMDEWGKVMELMGGRGCYFDIAFVLDMMRKNETAKELYRQNEDYFVFGTDSPWADQKRYVQMIRDSNTLSDEQREKMFYRNILKLIKIN